MPLSDDATESLGMIESVLLDGPTVMREILKGLREAHPEQDLAQLYRLAVAIHQDVRESEGLKPARLPTYEEVAPIEPT